MLEDWRTAGFWGVIDGLSHQRFVRLPRYLQRIICDRFELAVGISREQLAVDYNGRLPWWCRV